MNTYELTILFPEDPATPKGSVGASKDKVLKMITGFVKKHKGEINKTESWGAKYLTYPIRKLKVAEYEHLVLTIEPAAQVELDKTLRLDESILRYMFVRV